MALSTLQAEYMALSDASRECIARSHFYEELELPIPTPVIHSDNQGALVTAQDPTNYSRTKHIDLRYHFIRDCIEDGTLAIDYVPGEDNPADIFTKLCLIRNTHVVSTYWALKWITLRFLIMEWTLSKAWGF